MKLTHLFAFLSIAALAACTGPTRTAPTLDAPTLGNSQPIPPKRGILEQAGDTTWRVVTAPALLIPSKKPATNAPPETYEAPGVTIVRRDWSDQPALLPPPSPAPATQPATP